jgi:hypothetical protein
MITVSFLRGGTLPGAYTPAKRRPRWGRIALALIVLNEIRGLCVVAALVWGWWRARG